jgi:hypothetical protein
VRKSLTALAAVLGVPCTILASAGVIAAPQAAAQPPECGPNPNMTTAYFDTSWTSHNDGVWVACVPYTNVTHDCYASGSAKKLYRRGEGPAPECRSIYNSR